MSCHVMTRDDGVLRFKDDFALHIHEKRAERMVALSRDRRASSIALER